MTATLSFSHLLLLCTVACTYSLRETPRCESQADGESGHDNLRLVDFNSSLAGHVEVCNEGLWSKLLISDIGSWSRKNSIVVCRELGYLNALHVTNINERYILKNTSSRDTNQFRGYHSIQCSGLEETLSDCKTRGWNASIKTPSTSQQPLVMCVEAPAKGELRLVGSGPDNQGVLQVYHPNKIYKWSTVCTNEWDDNDARVACKQLGYQSGKSVLHKGNQNLLPRRRYDNYDCSGSESSLAECSFDGPYPLRCFSANNQYAGVKCQEMIDGDSNTIGITDPHISLVVLITGVLLLLIAIIGMLLRCIVKRFRRKISPRPLTSVNNRPQRVTLSSQYWQQNGTNTIADAPPTYEETVSVVQSNNNLIENHHETDTYQIDTNTHETDTHQIETDTHETDTDTQQCHETDTCSS